MTKKKDLSKSTTDAIAATLAKYESAGQLEEILDAIRTAVEEVKDPYVQSQDHTHDVRPEKWDGEGEGPSPEAKPGDVARALAALSLVKSDLIRCEDVTAVDVGFRVLERTRSFTPDVCVRVHVAEKKSPEMLEKHQNYSRKEATPFAGRDYVEQRGGESSDNPYYVEIKLDSLDLDSLDLDCLDAESLKNVRVDVVEGSYSRSATSPAAVTAQPQVNGKEGVGQDDVELRKLARSSVMPIVGGLSIGNGSGPAGTIGAVVWDTEDGSPCILSNWHVLAGNANAQVGQRCYQPAKFDGGTDRNLVGHLKRWQFDPFADAALAQIRPDLAFCSGEILGLFHPVVEMIPPRLGMRVRKWGRASGFTQGFIDGLALCVKLDFGDETRVFEDQLHIAPRFRGQEVSRGGDSGSMWVFKAENEVVEGYCVKEYYAVALHFAGDRPGSPQGEFAVATPIDRLSESLGFSLRPLFLPCNAMPIPDQLEIAESDLRGSRVILRPGGLGLVSGNAISQPDVRDTGDTGGSN